jgi:hypothetical protein
MIETVIRFGIRKNLIESLCALDFKRPRGESLGLVNSKSRLKVNN